MENMKVEYWWILDSHIVVVAIVQKHVSKLMLILLPNCGKVLSKEYVTYIQKVIVLLIVYFYCPKQQI